MFGLDVITSQLTMNTTQHLERIKKLSEELVAILYAKIAQLNEQIDFIQTNTIDKVNKSNYDERVNELSEIIAKYYEMIDDMKNKKLLDI
jgi:hypothetical protein